MNAISLSGVFTPNALIQIIFCFSLLLLLAKPLGHYMANLYQNKVVWLTPFLSSLEQALYRATKINPAQDMSWQQYAMAVVVCSAVGFSLLYGILLFQETLPLNPQAFPGLNPDRAFGITASFVTNTNWQSYSGETTLSYFSQMVGLAVQNFVSAGIGMAVLAAVIRGFSRKESSGIGNFWVDFVRTVLYILLPLSFALAIGLISQGVVQTFKPPQTITLQHPFSTVKPGTEKTIQVETQTIPLGPVASQVAIKQLGTNGGGFFNTNSAHPLENPTALSNLMEWVAILLIPIALCFTFGKMVNDLRQGWALLATMSLLFVPLMFFSLAEEQIGNPFLTEWGINQHAGPTQAGGNMEGKEARFGITQSVLWETATTATSNGSVNSMHDSYTPLGGLVALILMQFGEVIYGGVGSGLYGMLIFSILTVFIAGLMVGRTPEYLGKKIQAYEIKMASIAILVPAMAVLFNTAFAVVSPSGIAGLLNHGPHGFSEILYAFTSAGMNNGSAFGGLNTNSPFYNTLQGLAMLFGRYWVLIPALAIAGSLASKKSVPISSGTLPTHTPLFIVLLASVVIMVGVLTFVPALALGPVAEWLMSN